MTYLAVTLAGTLARSLPGDSVSRAIGLLLAMLLTGLYAMATAPGRRSHWSAYLAAGATCPLAIMLLAGFSVGVRITGSTDPALGAIVLRRTLLLWWLGMAAAVLIPVAIRGVLRVYRTR